MPRVYVRHVGLNFGSIITSYSELCSSKKKINLGIEVTGPLHIHHVKAVLFAEGYSPPKADAGNSYLQYDNVSISGSPTFIMNLLASCDECVCIAKDTLLPYF